MDRQDGEDRAEEGFAVRPKILPILPIHVSFLVVGVVVEDRLPVPSV